MKIVVTGATGYIGSTLISAIERRGGIPVSYSRTKPANASEWVEYDLTQDRVTVCSDVACVIHLAMNMHINCDLDQQNEIRAAVRLIEASSKVGAKFIYLSSQTASDNAATFYGQTKWQIEKIVKAHGGVIVRPGLVYGGAPLGLFFQLASIVKKVPLIPYFIPSPMVQPVHVEDLCEGILKISEEESSQDLFCIASINPVKFHVFLKLLAIHKLRKKRFVLPFPRFLIDLANKLFPNIPALNRLHSLFTLPFIYTRDDLSQLKLELRSLSSGLHPSGCIRRRLIIVEGYILFSYLLRERPKLMMIRRYVKAIECLGDKKSLGFNFFLIFFPTLVSLIEANLALKKEEWFPDFVWRLNIATSISEASIQGAKRYLNIGGNTSFIKNLALCIKAVLYEIFIRLFSTILGRSIRYFISSKVERYES